MLFNTLRAVRLALKSLLLHKLRSGLTMLGIVFGVFSVIAMLAIGEGASAQAQAQVRQLGATNIIVLSIKPPEDSTSNARSSGRGPSILAYGLLRADYRLLAETIPTITSTIAIREIQSEVRHLQNTLNARVVATSTGYMEMNHLELSAGRFLTDQDERDMANVAVIGADVAQRLFPYESPIGQTILLRSFRFTVVGVTRSRTASAAIGGSMSGQDFNKDVYIPLKTFQTRIGDRVVTAISGSFSAEEVQLNQITLQVGDTKDVVRTADVVRESLGRNHRGKNDYDVIVPLELLKQAEQIKQIFNIVLGSIAAISLVVGGIGIMNIMLATVTERTREIGIRRALGARQSDIISQFLTETIVLSGTGGLLGVAMGLCTPVAFLGIQWIVDNVVLAGSTGTSEISQLFGNMQPKIAFWSLPVAFGISVGIGVIFGIYPARSAARMDPIEALRHE
ncbi:MAG: ABC transporter ATP-binding protein [Planctomyces sp.]|nr:ABC transporter ATP-binding protein [Planctomyces sp.]